MTYPVGGLERVLRLVARGVGRPPPHQRPGPSLHTCLKAGIQNIFLVILL